MGEVTVTQQPERFSTWLKIFSASPGWIIPKAMSPEQNIGISKKERELDVRTMIHRATQGRPRKQARGIERRQRRIRVVHNQGDLSAPEDDGVASLLFHPPHDSLKVIDRLGLEVAANQLIHDDVIHFFAL